MASSIPQGLKIVKKFLIRALELDRMKVANNEVMAFCMRRYALTKALKDEAVQADPEAKTYLITMMDKLEKEKPGLISKYGAVMENKPDQLELIRNFGTTLFKKASDQYQSGNANKRTAALFNSAATYFEVAGVDDEDLIAARKTAKFKAMEIFTAIKEGRPPIPPSTENEEPIDEGDNYGFTADLPAVPMGDPGAADIDLPTAPDHQPFSPYEGRNIPRAGILDLDVGSSNDNSGGRNLGSFEDMGAPRLGEIPTNAKLSVRGREFFTQKFNMSTTTDKQASRAESFCRAAVTALNNREYGKVVQNIAAALGVLENRKPKVFAPETVPKAAVSDAAEYLLFAARTLETAGGVMPANEAKARAISYLSNALMLLQR